MSDKFKESISRAIRSGVSFDIANTMGREIENISFANPLYEASLLYSSGDDESTTPFLRFKGYSRLSEKQKLIEEIIRQAELYHEDSSGIKAIKYIQTQSDLSVRFKYLSSVGLLFAMKFTSLELYNKQTSETITNFFEKALNASVPPLDVIRYYRYLYDTESSLPFSIHLNLTSNTIRITNNKCNKKFNKDIKYFSNIKLNKNNNNTFITLYKSENNPILVRNEEGNEESFKLELYRNDTIETIRLRYAYLNSIPFEMVKVTILEKFKVENETIINNVKLKFISENKWKINELEDKIIIVNSIIDIIEDIPIDLSNSKTILSSLDTLITTISTEFNIQKTDIYYLYLIIRYQIFDGKDIIDENNKQVDSDIIINDIENNIEYLELLIAMPLDKNKFSIVIQNYCESLLLTNTIGLRYTDVDKENNIFEYLNNVYRLPLSYKKEYTSNIKETDFTIHGSFELDGIDLYEIFNKIVCNRTIPFINLSNFYKCLNEVKVPIEWCKQENESNDILRLFIYPNIESDVYCICEIKQVAIEKGINKYEYSIYATIDFNIDLILNKFIEILPFLPKEMIVIKEFGKGYFLINSNDIDFQEDVFYDFCLNNKIMSEMLNIDEKYKIHKIRGGLKFIMNLNKLNNSQTIRCILKMKQIEKSTEQEVKDFPTFAKVGSNIMSISISGAINQQTLNYYKHMIECFFEFIKIYKQQFYIDYYCSFFDNIEEYTKVEKKQTVTKDLLLKEIVPDLFLSGYVRSCSYPPSIILGDIDDEKIDKSKIMLFPKKESEQTSFYYTCDKDTKKIYPGLRLNDMENTDIYPVIPCCYQDNQLTKGTIRYNYENNLPIVSEGQSEISTFITTRKLLKSMQEGALPSTIKNLLTMTDNSALLGESEFIRIAVPKGPHSIIDALKISTKTNLSNIQIIEKMKKLVNMNLMAQSGIHIEEAQKILNFNNYIDVKDWAYILEPIFNVKIAIFISTKDNDVLSHENYSRYLILPSESVYENMVLILNTTGGEFDRIDYPHNECIVKTSIETKNKHKQYISLFNKQSETSKAISTIYKRIIQTKDITIPQNIKSYLTNQKQDGYGKIREIIIQNTTIYTSPIYSIFSNYSKYDSLLTTKTQSYSIQHALSIFKFINISDIAIIKYKNKPFALIGNNDTTDFIIKITLNNTLEESNLIKSIQNIYPIQTNGYPIPPSEDISFIKTYNYYNRLANYITSYACYLYSNLKQKDNQLTIELFKNNIIINKNINYGELNRLFKQDNIIIKNDKLQVENESIKLRIIFYLQMLENNSSNSLNDYYLLKYIPSYYNHADDFDKSENYTVYNNIEEYLETRRLKKAQYALYDRLFKSNVSYFFSSEYFDEGKYYLAIPATTKQVAINRSLHYYKTNNILFNPPVYSDTNYSILVQTENDLYIESDFDSNIWIAKLIIHKLKDEEYFFSLIAI